VLDAIRASEDLIGNRPLAAALRTAHQQIAAGKTIAAAFDDTGLFPPLVVRMLKVGENTGALDTALQNVSYFYDRDVREAIGKLQSMVEPVLTLLLGTILGWVMLAVLGPVYDSIAKLRF
jgi:type IV pilus assembly protein PilC